MVVVYSIISRPCNVTSGTRSRVTDVTFRFAAFVGMIRLNR